MNEQENFMGEEEDDLEGDDNITCDFDKADAEEAALMKWAHSVATLTEKNITERLQESRENLEDLGKANIKSFMRVMRWRLNKLLAEQDLEHMEPDDEEILAMELGQKKRKKNKKEKQPEQAIPMHVEQIGGQKLAVYSVETDETEEEQKLRKPVKDGIKKVLQTEPDTLKTIDQATALALALGSTKAGKHGMEVIENIEKYFTYINKRLAKKSIELPTRKTPTIEESLQNTLNEKETTALQYLMDCMTCSDGKATRDSLFLITEDTECDTFECPLCIRTLESKLEGTTYSLEFKTIWATRFDRVPEKQQGQRFQWVKLVSKD